MATKREFPSGEKPLWIPYDSIEETERVERHLGMARQMLEDKENDQDTKCSVSFSRIIEQDGMLTLAPGEHMGTLLGIEEGEEPTLIVGEIKIYLTHGGEDTDEPEIDMLIGQSDLERVPLREIDAFYGATATPETWEYLEEHGREGESL